MLKALEAGRRGGVELPALRAAEYRAAGAGRRGRAVRGEGYREEESVEKWSGEIREGLQK